MQVNYAPLLELSKEVDDNYIKTYLQRSMSLRKSLYPALSVTVKSKTGLISPKTESEDKCTLGQFLPHIGYIWFIGDIEDLSVFIYEEERLLHTLSARRPDFFDMVVNLHLHGYSELRNDQYRWWEPLLEGEVISSFYLQTVNTPFFDTFLTYLMQREPLHIWVAAKLIEVMNLLRILNKRKSEVISKTKHHYEDIDIAFEISERIASSSYPMNAITTCVLSYHRSNIQVARHPVQSLSSLVEELRHSIKAEASKAGELLTSMFANFGYAESTAINSIILTLNFLELCLESNRQEIQKESMRALLGKFDAVTYLDIRQKSGQIFYFDPIFSWLLNTRVGIWPIYHYVRLDDSRGIINTIDRYFIHLKEKYPMFDPDELRRQNFVAANLEYSLERVRLEFARDLLPKLAHPQKYTKSYGDIVIKSGIKLLYTFLKCIEDLCFAYKNEDAQKGEKALLIKILKSPEEYLDKTYLDLISRDPAGRLLHKLYLDAVENATRLLEGFDFEKTKKELNSLLVDIITDYEFAESLINEQIKPTLKDTLPIDRWELTPYFLY
jgi:hypothetical protein